jgi:hypothetical protein
MGKVSSKVTDPSGAVLIGANLALTRFESVLFQALLTADIDKELGFRHTDKVGKTNFDNCQAAPQ